VPPRESCQLKSKPKQHHQAQASLTISFPTLVPVGPRFQILLHLRRCRPSPPPFHRPPTLSAAMRHVKFAVGDDLAEFSTALGQLHGSRVCVCPPSRSGASPTGRMILSCLSPLSREWLEGFSLETSLLSVETEESALVIMDVITSMETDQDGPSSPAATTPHLAGTEGL
jgi:hypothetical protein